ncbi:MAG: hypothetical protein ABIK28_15115 [Planctomycetota bacterium]
MDLTDIIDIKAGLCYFGAGAKIEATDYIAAGLGFGVTSPFTKEFFGRFADNYGGVFLHFGFIGGDGVFFAITDRTFFFYNMTQVESCGESRIPFHSRFRFGGEFVLPLLSFGAYLNLGELVDFVTGFVGLDIALDDGYAKGSSLTDFMLHDYREEVEKPGKIKEALSYIQSGDEFQRGDAARILGKYKVREAIEDLIYILENDRSSRVKNKAADALKEITGQDYGIDAETWKNWWSSERAADEK